VSDSSAESTVEGATRDIAEVPAVEIITTAAVHLMSAAAVKVGLADDPDQQVDLDEARKLINALAGLITAVQVGGFANIRSSWTLSAGPSWFAGANDALKKVAGKSVEIKGTHTPDSTELDVESIDGVAVRAAGKPAWAGGPWTVGASHPGWKDWMADGKPGKGLGREKAPGQNKDSSGD